MSAAWLVHPEWLPLTLVVLASAAGAVLVARIVARRRRRAFLGAAEPPRGDAFASDLLLLLALAATLAALLGPRLGQRVVWMPGSGVDLVLLLDVSRSMDARDVPPSRIDRARRAARELLARLAPADRAALAVFARRGVLLTPLTPDRAVLDELLGAVDTDLVHPASSNLGDGVRAALAAFETGSHRPRVLFVLSDGEDARRGDLGAAEAARADVRVLTGALGTESGAPLFERGEPLRDRRGQAVVTRRDVARLAALAEATGGAVFAGDDFGEFDFDAAAAALHRDAGNAAGDRIARRVPAVRVGALAALAFALLLVEGLPRPRRPGAPTRRAIVPVLALCLLASPARPESGPPIEALESGLRARPHDARLLLEVGRARLERGRRAAAARAFLAAAAYADEPRIAALGYYDLGVTSLHDGDLEGARDAFFDALALHPGDDRARFNLEWTLRALSAERPPPVSPPPAPEDVPPADSERREEAAPSDPQPAAPPARRVRLADGERERWLERVADDPSRALRAAARGSENTASPRRGPAAVW